MKTLMFWRLVFLMAFTRLHLSTGISVQFRSRDAVGVAPGKPLVLKADFQIDQGESIFLYTWDCKGPVNEIRLYTKGDTSSNMISVERNGQTLMIQSMSEDYYGTYTVTVTNNKGIQKSDSVQVKKVEKAPTASIALQCSVTQEGAQWDTPVFSWWENGIQVTNETGKLSTDGRILYLSENLHRNYACIVESSQGTSSVQIKGPDEEPKPTPKPCPEHSCSGYKVVIIILVIINLILIIILVIVIYKFREYRKKNGPSNTNGRQRSSSY